MRTPFPPPGLLAPALSLALAVAVFGVSFGVLAASSGLSPLQAAGMSALVFTGSAPAVADITIRARGVRPWARA